MAFHGLGRDADARRWLEEVNRQARQTVQPREGENPRPGTCNFIWRSFAERPRNSSREADNEFVTTFHRRHDCSRTGATNLRKHTRAASIVIAAHNEGDLLWKTVQACQETITELEYEIVVVDDASVDDSAEAIRRRHEDVKLIVSPSRTGTSAAKDLAVRSSRGDVLVFLDAHCKPEPGAIERLVQDVERWHETAIVSPRIAGLDPLRWENHASPGCNGFWVDLSGFTPAG